MEAYRGSSRDAELFGHSGFPGARGRNCRNAAGMLRKLFVQLSLDDPLRSPIVPPSKGLANNESCRSIMLRVLGVRLFVPNSWLERVVD